jgi:hypothetical protein
MTETMPAKKRNPVFFGFSLNRSAGRVLHLEPVRRAPRATDRLRIDADNRVGKWKQTI